MGITRAFNCKRRFIRYFSALKSTSEKQPNPLPFYNHHYNPANRYILTNKIYFAVFSIISGDYKFNNPKIITFAIHSVIIANEAQSSISLTQNT